MLINKKSYKLNPKTGEIIGKQRVVIKCDICGAEWESQYVNYKTYRKDRIKTTDWCVVCKNKNNGSHKAIKEIREEIKCGFCGKKFIRRKSKKKRDSFCNFECYEKYMHKKKFQYLLDNEKRFENEISYLIGVILGDGTMLNTESKKRPLKRVYIYCDIKKPDIIKSITNVLKKMKLKYCQYLNRKSCLVVSFSLPLEIVRKWGMAFNGDKYRAQPSPKNKYIKNINYAIGLLNTDGYLCSRGEKEYKEARFCNTVKSISNSLSKCLRKNKICYRRVKEDPKQKGWKETYWVIIGQQSDIEKLIELSQFELKEFRKVK